MGYSYETQLPVATAILQRFPATVMVAMFGIFFELLIGIPIGMISALQAVRHPRPHVHGAQPRCS